jgi:ferredoxin
MLYHIGRIFHQAGRCVQCGACERACPTNVNLGLFTRLLADEVKERFAFEPGMSTEQPGLLSTFNPDDKQEFMTEPDRNGTADER